MPERLVPYFLLVLTVSLWSGNVIIGRFVGDQVPPAALSLLRWSIAFAVALPFGWRHLRIAWPDIVRHRNVITFLGVIGVGLFNVTQYAALGLTTAINVGLINATIPILIPIVAYVLARERVTARTAAGIAVSLAGVLTILGRGEIGTLAGLRFNAGDLLSFLAMIGWAVYSVKLRAAPRLHPLAFMLATVAVGIAVNVPLALVERALGYEIVWSAASAMAIAYTGIFPSIVAYMSWNVAVARVGATTAGLFLNLFPLTVGAMAIALLGERLEWYHLPGAGLVFAGIWLATKRRLPPKLQSM